MLERSRKIIRAVSFGTLAASVLFTVFWVLLLLLCRDKEAPGYFVRGAAGETAYFVLLLAAAALLVVAGVLLRREKRGIGRTGDSLSFFASVGCGFLLLAYAVVLGVLRAGTGGVSGALYIAALVLAVPGAAGFFLRLAPEGFLGKRRLLLATLFDIALLFFCFAYAFASYAAVDLPVGSPIKQMDQVCFLFFALFALGECGLRIGRFPYAVYLPLTAAAVVLGFANGVGGIAVYLGSGAEETLRDSVLHDFLQLLFALYAAARLYAEYRTVSVRQSRALEQVTQAVAVPEPETQEVPKDERAPGERDRGDTDGVGFDQQTIDFRKAASFGERADRDKNDGSETKR